MIIKNRLDRVFGPYATSMGLFLFIGGLAGLWVSLYCIIIALTGAFVSFTSTSTTIDREKQKIRFSNNLFGFIPAGKWRLLTPGMKLGLKKIHRGFMTYIRANQPIGIHYNDIRIILYGEDGKEIMQVKKFNDRESAKEGIKEYCRILNLSQTGSELP